MAVCNGCGWTVLDAFEGGWTRLSLVGRDWLPRLPHGCHDHGECCYCRDWPRLSQLSRLSRLPRLATIIVAQLSRLSQLPMIATITAVEAAVVATATAPRNNNHGIHPSCGATQCAATFAGAVIYLTRQLKEYLVMLKTQCTPYRIVNSNTRKMQCPVTACSLLRV